MKIKFTKLPKSEVQLDISFDEKSFADYHDRGFKAIQNMVEIDGFRKGHASEDVIVKSYGDMIILEEMANIALRDAYVQALTEHKLIPVADPKVTITKLAKGNPLELTMVVPVIPEVALPSYKKLAKEVMKDGEKIEVTDKDIDDVIEELRKGRAHQHEHDHEGHDHEGHDHAHGEHNHEHKEGEDKKETPLPVIGKLFTFLK